MVKKAGIPSFTINSDAQHIALEHIADDNSESTSSVDTSVSSHDHDSSTSTITLDLLPMELIDEISSYLSLKDFVNFRQKTCSKFRDSALLDRCMDV